MKPPDDDHDLVLRFQSEGDSKCFEDLYLRHREPVYRLIAKVVLNEHAAQDLTQDTFVKASRNIHQFNGTARFRTWLCRIAVNSANEYLRKMINGRERLVLLGNSAETAPGPDSPRDSLFRKEKTARVTTALQHLEPDLRTALVLTVMEGLDPREAAEIQGCTRSTLYWRIHKARKILKEAMAYE